MFQTSKEYKESMKRPIRNESYMKILLILKTSIELSVFV